MSRLNPTVLIGFAAGTQARAGRNSGRHWTLLLGQGLSHPHAIPTHVSCSSLSTQLKSLGGRAHALSGESQKHMTPEGEVTSVQGSERLFVTNNATHHTHTHAHTQLCCLGLGP